MKIINLSIFVFTVSALLLYKSPTVFACSISPGPIATTTPQEFFDESTVVFSGKAIEYINDSIIDEVVITDTIPFKGHSSKIRIASIADLVAETIRRINNEESISLLLDDA